MTPSLLRVNYYFVTYSGTLTFKNSDTETGTIYGIWWYKSLLNISILFFYFPMQDFKFWDQSEDSFMAKKPPYGDLKQRANELEKEVVERKLVEEESGGPIVTNKLMIIISGIFILLGLYLLSLYNYLLFHSIAEIFSVIIACVIFMVAWNSRRFLDNNYLLFLGIAYLFIAGLDLVHTLGYKGMAIFKGYDTNLATQLWIAARYMESLSLLIAPLFSGRAIRIRLIFAIYIGVFFLSVGSVFGNIFPTCFVEGTGLTLFKKISEYIISLILIGAIILLFQKRKEFDEGVLQILIASIAVTITSELAFTFYIHAYGFSNLIGHILKIISFYLIYKAIIETGLVRPYDLLFRNLKKSEEDLRYERDNLQKALAKVKTLSGLLPICANCKKIRDDKGYWNQIEAYIRDHSEADFSHSICPECAKNLYPEFYKGD